MAVNVLDGYYLTITLLITIAYQLIGLSLAYTFKFDKLTDFCGGSNFVILAIVTVAFPENPNARQIIASVLMMTWGVRLAGFLLFRILKTGKDDRFDDKRDKFFSFLGFWVAQMVWVWTVSLPVTLINSPKIRQYRQPSLTACDGLGITMWAVGFILESFSDIQKYRFRSNSANKGGTCQVIPFNWSRHPNYFGEIIQQFGIFTVCVSPAAYGYIRGGAYAALYASMLGPWFLTLLLLFVSGMNLQERPGAKKKYEADGPNGAKWLQHKHWLDTTSVLVPMPPALWKMLPTMLKRTLFFEFPIYVFDLNKHADQRTVQDRQAREARMTEKFLTTPGRGLRSVISRGIFNSVGSNNTVTDIRYPR